MSSIHAGTDPSEMSQKQLRDMRTDRDNLKAAIARTYNDLINDNESLEEIINDNWLQLMPLLMRLVRENNLDAADPLQKKMIDIVGNIAVRRTAPPEPSSRED